MWFKCGQLDELQDGATNDNANANEYPLPIEERYLDSGNVSPADSLAFGVHSGRTGRLAIEMFEVVKATAVVTPDPSELQVLARELAGRRRLRLAAFGGVIAAIVAIAAVFAVAT